MSKVERRSGPRGRLAFRGEANSVDAAEKIRPEEGFALLRKWKDEYTPLRVYFSMTGFGADFNCSVADIAGTLLTLNLQGSPVAPWFELKGCLFTYGDPPRAIAQEAARSGRQHRSALLVKSFSGPWNVAFMELVG